LDIVVKFEGRQLWAVTLTHQPDRRAEVLDGIGGDVGVELFGFPLDLLEDGDNGLVGLHQLPVLRDECLSEPFLFAVEFPHAMQEGL
jgi:hypothetical protein